ncbi:MAG: site-specific integrase [Candidatus Omnitrophota bacterium]
MRNKIAGVREVIKGEKYEINFVVNRRRFQYRIDAKSPTEAYNIKLTHITDKRKELESPFENTERLSANFSEAWERLNSSLLADNLPPKTVHHYKKTYGRIFDDFRNKAYSHLQSFNQLRLSFFEEYKSYYVNDLARPRGWRAELGYVKSIINRLYRLGYCSKDLLESLKEIKKPQPNKKDYPNIPASKIKELLQSIKQEGSAYYYPIYFMCRTGRRVNEVTLIERKDVEWQGLRPVRINIRAETTKMKVTAPLVRLDSELEQLVKESYSMNSNRKTVFLFPNRLGKKCSPDKLRGYLKEKSKGIVSIKITPHYFRHRFLTECGKAGVPMVDVMSISGIKDVDVVVRFYSHNTEEGLSKVLEVSKI